MAGNEWGDVLNVLTGDFKDILKNIKISNYVGFCLGNNELRKFTENYLLKLTSHKKSNPKCGDVAIAKKNEGNKKYQEKKLEESLLLYTESIFHGRKNDETLPLAYSNRSLVLLQMGRFSDCLQDVDMALSTGYHQNKSWKLMLRKAECLAHLGEFQKARQILTECGRKPHDKRTLQNVSNEIVKLENSKNKLVKATEYQLPEIAGGENENFIYASNYLSVFYNKTKGRHVLATHDIEMGDVLFVEKPFTFVVLKEACHNCCKKLIAPIPCWNCLDVSYCSPICRDKSWEQIHHLECGYNGIFKSFGIAYLSLRIVLSASSKFTGFKKILNEVNEFSYEEGLISWTSKDYEGVYNLVTHTEKYEICDLFQYVMTAILLTLHMKNHTNYFPKASTDEDLNLFASAIWRHMMQLICNCHAIIDTFVETNDGKLIVNETEERLGSAVYPSAAMMNHSCESSIMYSFYKNYLIARAGKAIKKGEEVCMCYGPNARRTKRSERQEILRKQYFFNCECEPCLQSFDIQDKFTALKCSNCKGPLIPNEEEEEEDEDSRMRICLNCKEITEISMETLEKQDLIYSLIQEGEDLLEKNVKSALTKFLKSWRLGREIFYKFHRDLSYTADQVARCLAELQDYTKAIRFLKCCVLSVEERFGSFSIELANESKKLGDALFNCSFDSFARDSSETRERAREGVESYERAEKIFTLLYGPQYRDLEEIKENRRKLEALCGGMFSTD